MAQIAVDKALEVAPVLDVERIVEPELLPDALDDRVRGAEAGVRPGRVDGREERGAERERDDCPEDEDRPADALRGVAEHGLADSSHEQPAPPLEGRIERVAQPVAE